MGFDKDRVVPGALCPGDINKVREAVCIQVEKIYDSCREKDCIENAPVLFRPGVQRLIDCAINVKIRKANVIDVFADIEEVPFKKGFFTVDIKFFILVTVDFFVPNGPRPGLVDIVTRKGLVLFDKKVILFGSEGNIKIFKSFFDERTDGTHKLQQDNLPISKVEVAEPIALNARFAEVHNHKSHCHRVDQMPRNIADLLDDDENDHDHDHDDDHDDDHHDHTTKIVEATLGIFSIIKLVRFVQLLIPAFDFCLPNNECIASTEENPCELFDTIEFPFNEFFPPQKFQFPGAQEAENKMRGDD
jgi:hypothetical protein